MTYDEHCKQLDALAGPGIAALDDGDEDAALLYVTAVIDYLLRHGEEMRTGAPPVDQKRLQEMKRVFRPILQAIEQRLGPHPPSAVAALWRDMSLRFGVTGEAWQ